MNDTQPTGPDLRAAPATLTAAIQIKRAATGKVENWTLTFAPLDQAAEQNPTQSQEASDVCHP